MRCLLTAALVIGLAAQAGEALYRATQARPVAKQLVRV